MRLVSLLVLVSACAVPVRAQVHVVPAAGYDLHLRAPTVGVGVEVGLTPPARAFTVAVRPMASYVFARDQSVIGDPFGTGTSGAPGSAYGLDDVRLVRANVDVVGRYRFPGTALSQYVRAGLVAEHTTVIDGSDRGHRYRFTGEGATLGVGLEYERMFAEAALGTLNVSTAQVAVGVRF